MIAMLALATSALSSLPLGAPLGHLCAERTHAAIVYEAHQPEARDAVDTAFARACFTLTEVVGTDDSTRLDAARAVAAPWLLVARASLAQQSSLITVDVTAFDVDSGQRRGRAMRSARLLAGERADSARASVRAMADAVRVLRAQIDEAPAQMVVDRAELSAEPAACAHMQDVVVLWHEASDASGQAAVLRGLGARCVKVVEQVDGERTQAMARAQQLAVPLVAVKTALVRLDGQTQGLVLTVDVVDVQVAGERILTHASDTRHAMRAADGADAWRKVERSLVAPVLERALP